MNIKYLLNNYKELRNIDNKIKNNNEKIKFSFFKLLGFSIFHGFISFLLYLSLSNISNILELSSYETVSFVSLSMIFLIPFLFIINLNILSFFKKNLFKKTNTKSNKIYSYFSFSIKKYFYKNKKDNFISFTNSLSKEEILLLEDVIDKKYNLDLDNIEYSHSTLEDIKNLKEIDIIKNKESLLDLFAKKSERTEYNQIKIEILESINKNKNLNNNMIVKQI